MNSLTEEERYLLRACTNTTTDFLKSVSHIFKKSGHYERGAEIEKEADRMERTLVKSYFQKEDKEDHCSKMVIVKGCHRTEDSFNQARRQQYSKFKNNKTITVPSSVTIQFQFEHYSEIVVVSGRAKAGLLTFMLDKQFSGSGPSLFCLTTPALDVDRIIRTGISTKPKRHSNSRNNMGKLCKRLNETLKNTPIKIDKIPEGKGKKLRGIRIVWNDQRTHNISLKLPPTFNPKLPWEK